METHYHIIKSTKELNRLIELCKYYGYACVDFETNGKPLYNKDFSPTILSVTCFPGYGFSIPLDHPETKDFIDGDWDWKKSLKKFGREVIENPSITKIAWNAQFDFKIFDLYHIYYRGTLLDGMLAKYVLNEERPNGLKEMVVRYLPEAAGYEKDKGFDKIPWDQKPLYKLCEYGCQDTDYTFRLTIFFEKKLIDNGFYSLFRNMIMPASRVLHTVEANGLYMDRDFNKTLLETYKPKIDNALEIILNLPRVKKFIKAYNQEKIDNYIASIEKELEELDPNNPADKRKIYSREAKISNIRAGIFTTKKEQDLIRGVNLGSNTDLPQLMYLHKKGFKMPILGETESGKPSTSEDTLVELRLKYQDPESAQAIFLDNLLELRGLEKMYKTYVLGWSEKVQDDSCLHGRFQITGTTSGRLSSAEPNMQQIPKTSVDPNIKKQLVARPGKLYMAMDFSQAELRIMAHLSGDETYLKAFAEGQDPHLAIAAKKYGIPYQEAKHIMDDENHPDHKIWKTRRKQAKQIAFGIIYGIQAKLLSQKLSDPKAGLIVTPEEAQEQLDGFFQEHPKIKKFMKSQEKFLRKNGYIESLFGRRRRLPQIFSEDSREAAYAVRLAVNMPCQSTASDMCLFGSILLYWLMRQGKFPKMDSVCLVHDANYFNPDPNDINIWTVWKMWDIFRNPKTQEYFGFQISDVDMSMDFEIGRSMAEELPFIPGYDYNKMLEPDFSVDDYMEEHKKWKDVEIKDFPKLFPKEFKEYEAHYKSKTYVYM